MINRINYKLEKDIAHLRENGYVKISSVVNEKIINDFKETFFILLKNYSGIDFPNNFNSKDFVKKFKIFRENNEKKLQGLFRAINQTENFKQLFTNSKVKKIVSNLLNTSEAVLIISEHQFRIDEPNDELFTLEWHQDSAYYEQDKGGKNSLVLNICIQDCKKNMGSPNLVKGSHDLGLLNLHRYRKPKSQSLQLNTNSEYIKKENISIVEPKKGDLVIYDMNLIHKSGINFSNKARFSAIARVFNPISKNFHPFYFTKKQLVK